MNPPSPALFIIASYLLSEYGVPRLSGEPDHKSHLLLRPASFLALALILLAPWLSLLSIFGLMGFAFLREVVRSVVDRLQRQDGRYQIHWQSIQLALHLLLVLVWLRLFGLQLNSALATGPHRALLDTALGPTVLQMTGLVVAVGGGTVFIRALLSQIATPATQEAAAEHNLRWHLQDAEEVKVGRVIGNLERILIYVLALNGQLDAIGLVLAAKSLARFKELEEKSFSEYYLLGTLSSTLFALFAAWLVTATTSFFYPGISGALTLGLSAD